MSQKVVSINLMKVSSRLMNNHSSTSKLFINTLHQQTTPRAKENLKQQDLWTTHNLILTKIETQFSLIRFSQIIFMIKQKPTDHLNTSLKHQKPEVMTILTSEGRVPNRSQSPGSKSPISKELDRLKKFLERNQESIKLSITTKTHFKALIMIQSMTNTTAWESLQTPTKKIRKELFLPRQAQLSIIARCSAQRQQRWNKLFKVHISVTTKILSQR